MNAASIPRLGNLKSDDHFKEHLDSLQLKNSLRPHGYLWPKSPLRQPLVSGDLKIANRITVQPMEGWDGTLDGNPTEGTIPMATLWRHWGKVDQGGEAVPVSHNRRANPNPLLMATHTKKAWQRRAKLIKERIVAPAPSLTL